MIKIKPKAYTSIISLAVIAGAFGAVIHTENERAYHKVEAVKKYYSESYSNWDNYQKEYKNQVDALRSENEQEMIKTKETYETLLAQQDAIIQEHTRLVENVSYVQKESAPTANSNTNSTTKQIISVARPKAATTTGAS